MKRRGIHGHDVLTIDEAADYLGLRPSTIRNYLRSGRLREVRRSGYPRLMRTLDAARYRSGLRQVPLSKCPPLTIDL